MCFFLIDLKNAIGNVLFFSNRITLYELRKKLRMIMKLEMHPWFFYSVHSFFQFFYVHIFVSDKNTMQCFKLELLNIPIFMISLYRKR